MLLVLIHRKFITDKIPCPYGLGVINGKLPLTFDSGCIFDENTIVYRPFTQSDDYGHVMLS